MDSLAKKQNRGPSVLPYETHRPGPPDAGATYNHAKTVAESRRRHHRPSAPASRWQFVPVIGHQPVLDNQEGTFRAANASDWSESAGRKPSLRSGSPVDF